MSTKVTYLMSSDTLKTVAQGAIGAMTFGAYHQFTTNKIMDQNNEIQDQKHRQEMDAQRQMFEARIEKLEHAVEAKSRWW